MMSEWLVGTWDGRSGHDDGLWTHSFATIAVFERVFTVMRCRAAWFALVLTMAWGISTMRVSHASAVRDESWK
jgi:steroid 5-alpha reductase family enzyme